VDGWTVIPRALYDNDLSDLELQEVYVREAEKKYLECVADRELVEGELRAQRALLGGLTTLEAVERLRATAEEAADRLVEARRAETEAKAFLEAARVALRKYRPALTSRRRRSGSRRRASSG
jgi:hypothetical protein